MGPRLLPKQMYDRMQNVHLLNMINFPIVSQKMGQDLLYKKPPSPYIVSIVLKDYKYLLWLEKSL